MTVSPHDIARVLSEALPHMQHYDEEIHRRNRARASHPAAA